MRLYGKHYGWRRFFAWLPMSLYVPDSQHGVRGVVIWLESLCYYRSYARGVPDDRYYSPSTNEYLYTYASDAAEAAGGHVGRYQHLKNMERWLV